MRIPTIAEDLGLFFVAEQDAPLMGIGHPTQAPVQALEILDALRELCSLAAERCPRVRRPVIEDLAHGFQSEARLPIRDDPVQALQIVLGVLPVAG